VLLHAGVADRGMWTEHLAPLAGAGYRAVALDLPGFGDAPVAVTEDAPWNDVLATIDALHIDRAVLVGNSFGAAVALRLAVIEPDRVSGLFLVSAPAPGLAESPALQAAGEAEEAALERGDVDAAVNAVLSAWTLPGAPQALRDRVAAMQHRAFRHQLAASFPPEAPDPLDERLAALDVLELPTLLAAGEHDMADFREGAELLARRLPRARAITLARAGHLAPLETPAEFRQALLGFLSELDLSSG
jgi:pimeloyl-ACP methyl ester carboxylesterase